MDRLQLLLLVFAGMVALWLAWQGAKAWLRRGIRVDTGALAPEMPTLLYFSSEHCAPCRLQQAPAIELLRQRLGERFRPELELDYIERLLRRF